MTGRFIVLSLSLLSAVVGPQLTPADGPWLGNGIKSGEATQTSITVWTRLSARPDISSEGVPWPLVEPERDGDNWTFSAPQIPDGHRLADMAYTLPGASGEVRISYWPEATSNMSSTSEWSAVDAERDFTHQFKLDNLQPGTRYQCIVEGRPAGGGEPSARVQGYFRTAPSPSDAPGITFTVVTGQEFWRRDDEVNGHR